VLFLCVLVVALLVGAFVVLITAGGRERLAWPVLLAVVIALIALASWTPRAHLYAGIDGLIVGLLGGTIVAWFRRRRAG
jgi:hypothetical protein